MDPDWTLLSDMRKTRIGTGTARTYRPLTRDILIRLCEDQQLNFVVAREDIGFQPIRPPHSAEWKNLNLYDCRRVRG
jgi:hypothetical protein